jgi:NADPH:quinone reductase
MRSGDRDPKGTLMRAIQVHEPGGPEVLRLEEVDDPQPGDGQVRIRAAAIGVNFIDTYHRSGAYPRERPFVPGAEVAGTVDAVGPGVTDVAVGDRVATAEASGGYAELTLAPADRAVPVPDGVDLDIAAALMLQGLTAHYLVTSTFPLDHGQRALVHAAAGGVGLLLTQLAVHRGAEVIATVSTDEKAALARAAGAATVIRYTEVDDVAEEVRRLTGGAGLDVVYDGVGRTTFDQSLACLRPRGMLVLFGQSSGAVEPVDPQRLAAGGSLFLTRPTLVHYVADVAELRARALDLFGWVQAGALDVRIGETHPLAEAAEAHRRLEARATTGKVLLLP